MSIPVPRLSVWWDPPADGPTNMALDEALADEAGRRGEILVRVSTWSRAGVSLGAFQRVAEARACAALEGLPVVRRPSGGGAIVHGSDVTLALAVPQGHPLAAAPSLLYDAAHRLMVAELVSRGVPARLSAGTGSGEDPPDGPLLCFDRRSAGDVVVAAAPPARGDHKILGSAQRRLRGAVLQHGSLLLAGNAAVGEPARHAGLAELSAAAGPWRPSDGHEAIEGWLRRLAAAVGGTLAEDEERFCPADTAALERSLERFRSEAWLERR